MGLYIGNVGVNFKLPETIKSGSKIYGVTFDGTNSQGVRLYDSVDYYWEPSSTTYKGRDDFYDDVNSPFHTRRCLLKWNEDNEKFDSIFEDTNPTEYNSHLSDNDYIRMIAFPKFYFKRPNKWTFLVSSDPIPGFTISPMHYRNGVEDDYCYIAEYMIGGDSTARQISCPNVVPLTSRQMGDINTNGTFRKIAHNQHLYIQDYACRMMVCFLYLVKTANLNSQLTVGNGCSDGKGLHNMNDTGDSIKGQDGYRGTNIYDNTNIKCMGLVDYWGNAWEFIEGAASWCDASANNTLYYTNDPNKFTRYPTTLDEANSLGWELGGDLMLSGHNTDYSYFNEFKYEENHPFSLSPGGTYTSTDPNLTGDGFWQNYYRYTNQFIVLLCGGNAWNGSQDGLFYWNSNEVLSIANVNYGARAFVPGSSVLSPAALP